jgi:micrococcal nuclease
MSSEEIKNTNEEQKDLGWKYNLDAEKFSIAQFRTHAYVSSVYDGDTVHLIFGLPDAPHKHYSWTCRLSGIDTPEIRSRDLEEKKLGYAAKKALEDRILGKEIEVLCGKFDKYGRVLCSLYDGEEDLNVWMVESGFALEYDGGKKPDWRLLRK